MNISINLSDIFRDEDGDLLDDDEATRQAIKRQVIDQLTSECLKILFGRYDDELVLIMRSQLNEVMKTRMPSLVDDVMNTEFTPVNKNGQRSEPTTFRAEIIKTCTSEMTYEPKHYVLDENFFTRTIKGVLREQTEAFKEALKQQIDTLFKSNALVFAVDELKKRLGSPQ
ncbi:MAG: hypothetical protein LW834_13910 [Cyanobium sp. 49614_E6]|nr:hypothetical protein [Cyanobium sp. 49614_E6]